MVNYPQFKEIEKSDLALFEKAFNISAPEISEFTFTNLYSWRQFYQIKTCFFEDFIIVRSQTQDAPRFFEPIGKGDLKNAIKKISYFEKGIFIRIPEKTKDLFLSEKDFTIQPDEDNSDYLYKTQELVSLKGRKFDSKRNQIRKFKSNFQYSYFRLQEKNINQCLELEEEWCGIKNCDRNRGLSGERLAIREMLLNFSDFKLTGGALKIKDKMKAVCIGQRLNDTTLVIHVLKADPAFGGMYQVMLQEFLAREASDYPFINMEQDLGEEGLRKSKKSYQPIIMVKKYTLTPVLR